MAWRTMCIEGNCITVECYDDDLFVFANVEEKINQLRNLVGENMIMKDLETLVPFIRNELISHTCVG